MQRKQNQVSYSWFTTTPTLRLTHMFFPHQSHSFQKLKSTYCIRTQLLCSFLTAMFVCAYLRSCSLVKMKYVSKHRLNVLTYLLKRNIVYNKSHNYRWSGGKNTPI